MQNYKDLCNLILESNNFVSKEEARNKVGYYKVFGHQLTYDLSEGFPLLTLRKMDFVKIIDELLWFLKGSQNVDDLNESKMWWSKFTDKGGNVGSQLYGPLWMNNGTDNFSPMLDVLYNLEFDPFSRRNLLTTWSSYLNKYKDSNQLVPCHGIAIHFNVNTDDTLDLNVYQRSADVLLGLPVNISSYSTLLTIFSTILELTPGNLKMFIGDAHIYENHVDKINIMLMRENLPLPTLNVSKKPNIREYKKEDFNIENYQYHSHLTGALN